MEKYDFNTNSIEFSVFKEQDMWGDGSHESTQYMIEFLNKYGVEDKSVVDIGTGIGTLSILCKKLGARNILALDVDSRSIEMAKKNFEHNNVEVEAKVNDLMIGIDQTFDVVIANLPGPVQVENVKTVSKHINDGGLFIMSRWNKLPFEKFVTGFEVIEHIIGDDYDGYVLKKEK